MTKKPSVKNISSLLPKKKEMAAMNFQTSVELKSRFLEKLKSEGVTQHDFFNIVMEAYLNEK